MWLSGKRIEGAGDEQDLTSNWGNTADPDQIKQLAQQQSSNMLRSDGATAAGHNPLSLRHPISLR